MIGISKNKKDVLKNWNEELLKESARCPRIGLRDVVNEFDAHIKSGALNFAIIVFTSP